jgi:uroporphyrin-III C-methyltransferase / precorrin-2 dehydrogenase / sirohydrochlorin ferrochelatase
MDYLPIFLNLKRQVCLVVGAGEVAARKIELLLRAGADIHVVAPHISASVRHLQQQHAFTIIEKAFSETDLDHPHLVVCATNDRNCNRRIAEAAKLRHIPVNVVDDPALCSFIFPAIIDRSPLIVAVSSGGVSPVLARLLRAKLESLIPAAYGQLALFAERFRQHVKQHIQYPPQRRIFWESILQGPIAELVLNNQHAQAERAFLDSLNSYNSPATGEVYLIGAGPGDPDLLTFRALRLMQQADIIVYDRLVSPEVLDLARRDAERIYVGKERDHHTLPQESINELLVRLAQQGKRVARLKGGDPFIFGRGGEEIETLMQQNIAFQVVPGITAAAGCASYAGIPLTHRDHAQACLFVTGHLKDGSINLNWAQLAAPRQTVVIYMGVNGLAEICRQLIAHHCPKHQPIAIVENGTTAKQRVFVGTLQSIESLACEQQITSPALIIIGTVVNLRKQLNWFRHCSPEADTFI